MPSKRLDPESLLKWRTSNIGLVAPGVPYLDKARRGATSSSYLPVYAGSTIPLLHNLASVIPQGVQFASKIPLPSQICLRTEALGTFKNQMVDYFLFYGRMQVLRLWP